MAHRDQTSDDSRSHRRAHALALKLRHPPGSTEANSMRLFTKPHLAGFGWAIILAGSAGPALAAPFCIESQALPPQCNYFDAAQCQSDAARQGGVCSANPQQLTLQPGIGQFCLVNSGTGLRPASIRIAEAAWSRRPVSTPLARPRRMSLQRRRRIHTLRSAGYDPAPDCNSGTTRPKRRAGKSLAGISRWADTSSR